MQTSDKGLIHELNYLCNFSIKYVTGQSHDVASTLLGNFMEFNKKIVD